MTRELVLVGGGGTAADVMLLIDALIQSGEPVKVIGLLDDALPKGGERFGVHVLGGLSDASSFPQAEFVDCLGSPRSFKSREALISKLGGAEISFATLIHPDTKVPQGTVIGEGAIIYQGVTLLSGVTLGRHVTVLSGCILNHGVQVDDWSILASGAIISGDVSIGACCYIGAGSVLRDGICIGKGSLIGMGAAVVGDVAENLVVAGTPARELKAEK